MAPNLGCIRSIIVGGNKGGLDVGPMIIADLGSG